MCFILASSFYRDYEYQIKTLSFTYVTDSTVKVRNKHKSFVLLNKSHHLPQHILIYQSLGWAPNKSAKWSAQHAGADNGIHQLHLGVALLYCLWVKQGIYVSCSEKTWSFLRIWCLNSPAGHVHERNCRPCNPVTNDKLIEKVFLIWPSRLMFFKDLQSLTLSLYPGQKMPLGCLAHTVQNWSRLEFSPVKEEKLLCTLNVSSRHEQAEQTKSLERQFTDAVKVINICKPQKTF